MYINNNKKKPEDLVIPNNKGRSTINIFNVLDPIIKRGKSMNFPRIDFGTFFNDYSLDFLNQPSNGQHNNQSANPKNNVVFGDGVDKVFEGILSEGEKIYNQFKKNNVANFIDKKIKKK